jgi:hypothetical protein
MRSWLFPPRTREVPFDEKGAFVAEKGKNREPDDPDEDRGGDHGDHVAFDPEHRLVVSVVAGKRTFPNAQKLVDDFKARTRGRFMNRMTSDEYPAYQTATLNAYGTTVNPPRTGEPGRPTLPRGPEATAVRHRPQDATQGPRGGSPDAGDLRAAVSEPLGVGVVTGE